MALEPTFNFIDDLNENNPNNSPDQVKESANHLRGIKSAVSGSFPNLGQNAVTLSASTINDLVTPSSTDTLTNKTITAATFSGTQSGFTGNVSGNLTGNSAGTHTGSVVGNSSTASAFNSSRTITISGDATGSGASTTGQNSISISLANDSVRFSNEIANTNSTGTFTNGQVIPAGGFIIYPLNANAYNGTYTNVQYNTSAHGWRDRTGGDYGSSSALVFSDGANVRIVTSATSTTYRKIFL